MKGRSELRFYLLAGAVCTAGVLIGFIFGAPLFVDTINHQARATADQAVDAVEEIATENRELACATADLIAHVPAVQFEGEPIEDFIGWISARRDVLLAARRAQVCDARIIAALEARIEADDLLLRTLERGVVE